VATASVVAAQPTVKQALRAIWGTGGYCPTHWWQSEDLCVCSILIPAIPMLFGCASSNCWPLPRYGVLLLMPSSLHSPSALYSPSAGYHTARKFLWVPQCRAQPHPFVIKSHIDLVRGRDASMQRTTAHSTCIAIGVTPAAIGNGPRRAVGCGLRGDEVGESVAAKMLVEARLSMRVAWLERAAERALQPREMVGGGPSCS